MSPWVSGGITLAVLATLSAVVSEALRRHVSPVFMWAVSGFACLLIGVALTTEILRSPEITEPTELLLSVSITSIAAFLAPTYAVWRGSRTQSVGYRRQIGRGLIAAFGFFVLGRLVLWVFSRLLPS